jgi:hypothetical protein
MCHWAARLCKVSLLSGCWLVLDVVRMSQCVCWLLVGFRCGGYWEFALLITCCSWLWFLSSNKYGRALTLKYVSRLFSNRLQSLLARSPLVNIIFSIPYKSCCSRAYTNLSKASLTDFLNIFFVGPNMEITFTINCSVRFASRYLTNVLQGRHLLEPIKLWWLKHFAWVE